jgi:hypothetical protein
VFAIREPARDEAYRVAARDRRRAEQRERWKTRRAHVDAQRTLATDRLERKFQLLIVAVLDACRLQLPVQLTGVSHKPEQVVVDVSSSVRALQHDTDLCSARRARLLIVDRYVGAARNSHDEQRVRTVAGERVLARDQAARTIRRHKPNADKLPAPVERRAEVFVPSQRRFAQTHKHDHSHIRNGSHDFLVVECWTAMSTTTQRGQSVTARLLARPLGTHWQS